MIRDNMNKPLMSYTDDVCNNQEIRNLLLYENYEYITIFMMMCIFKENDFIMYFVDGEK